jgi:hypothetical protein
MHEAIASTVGTLLSISLITGMVWDWWRHPRLERSRNTRAPRAAARR